MAFSFKERDGSEIECSFSYNYPKSSTEKTYWSLSEFLNLLELRGQTWCFVDLAESGAFRVPHAHDAVLFYAVLEGAARVTGIGTSAQELLAGDVVTVLSGEAHTLRSRPGNVPQNVPLLSEGGYVDVPPHISVGHNGAMTRLLCGRLKVRWPGGVQPTRLPRSLKGRMEEAANFASIIKSSHRPGAAALLTRAASLLITSVLRDHPQCEELFSNTRLNDPIARAMQFIQTHPFHDWTVEQLARKVGMGRSSFATRFMAEIGMAPIEALTGERMKLAAGLLVNSALKVADIGERVGYRSEAAFCRRFASHFGMTPRNLRRKAQLERAGEGSADSWASYCTASGIDRRSGNGIGGGDLASMNGASLGLR